MYRTYSGSRSRNGARPGSMRPSHYSRRPTPNRGPNKQAFHPSQFIKPARVVEAAAYLPTHQFADFDIHPLLKQNVAAKGFVTPTQIQDQAIVPALDGKDVVGVANTGTGKTAAFAIPLLHQLLTNRGAKALIMAPTRELAQQIEQDCRALAKNSGLHGALLIGGTAMSPQIRDLRSAPQIVIGTPGRLKDHVQRGTLNLSGFSMVVLDEVDRMLDMGFITDIRFLMQQLAEPRQSLFFSATIDSKISQLINSFLREPVTISVKTGDTSDSVEQNVVRLQRGDNKMDKLHDVLIQNTDIKALIFDKTKRSTELLSKELSERGFAADSLHGGKSQGQRHRALERFRNNEISILVATDVAARGLDVADITHVINYSQPNSYDDYIHRIGRAGRAGRKGYALTFINQ